MMFSLICLDVNYYNRVSGLFHCVVTWAGNFVIEFMSPGSPLTVHQTSCGDSPTRIPPSRAMPSVTPREMACRTPWVEALNSPLATLGNTSSILRHKWHGHRSAGLSPRNQDGSLSQCFVFPCTQYLPPPINLFGCHSSSHCSHNCAQDAGHAVQVVNPAGVLDLQLFLQDGLQRGKEDVSVKPWCVPHGEERNIINEAGSS